jgi:urease accessory protein
VICTARKPLSINRKESPMKSFSPLAVLALMLVSGSALAHPGHAGQAGGLMAGLSHPYSGLDHALAMLAVGIWAAQQPARDAIWKIPLAFVATMVAGVLLGLAGFALPQVETGIAVSVLALGLLVAFSLRLPTPAGMVIVALFALLHGYAHGVEAPSAGLPGFFAGFVVATASLHGIGMALGWAARNRAQAALRLGGVGVALAGLWMALG